MPTYTFATPVFGGHLTVGAIGIYGGVSTSLPGSVTGMGDFLPYALSARRLARAQFSARAA